MLWGSVLHFSFVAGQGDVNMLILIVGTATPGTPWNGVNVCSSRVYGERRLTGADMALGNEIPPWVDIESAGGVGQDWVFDCLDWY